MQRGLRDEVAGIRTDLRVEVRQLRSAGLGADQHSVAPCFRHRLHHQLLEVFEHIALIVWPGTEVGGNVLDDRLLIEVVADHCRHVGVDQLVVGDAGARGVGDGDPSLPQHIDQARHPQHRVFAEHGGIKKIIVDAAVDHIHGFQAIGAAHPHPAAFAHQIAPLHQVNAHFLGQVAVFEIGAVEHPGRQDRHAGGVTPGRQVLKGAQQMGGIVVDWLNGTAFEQAREQSLHHPTVLEEVGHP